MRTRIVARLFAIKDVFNITRTPVELCREAWKKSLGSIKKVTHLQGKAGAAENGHQYCSNLSKV